MGLSNVTYLQEDGLALPLPDEGFAGAYFCYSLCQTGDIPRALSEAKRMLKPGGVLAVVLAPQGRGEARGELFVTDDVSSRPGLLYEVDSTDPLTGRRYAIYLDPGADLAQRVSETVLQEDRDPTIQPTDVLDEITAGRLGAIDHVDYYCVPGVDPAGLWHLLQGFGLQEITFWALPSEVQFAKALQEGGLLQKLNPEDHATCLRALVQAAARSRMPISDVATARKPQMTKKAHPRHSQAD